MAYTSGAFRRPHNVAMNSFSSELRTGERMLNIFLSPLFQIGTRLDSSASKLLNSYDASYILRLHLLRTRPDVSFE